MTDSAKSSPQPEAVIPPDALQRKLTVAYPDGPKMRHASIAGDTYTIPRQWGRDCGRLLQ